MRHNAIFDVFANGTLYAQYNNFQLPGIVPGYVVNETFVPYRFQVPVTRQDMEQQPDVISYKEDRMNVKVYAGVDWSQDAPQITGATLTYHAPDALEVWTLDCDHDNITLTLEP